MKTRDTLDAGGVPGGRNRTVVGWPRIGAVGLVLTVLQLWSTGSSQAVPPRPDPAAPQLAGCPVLPADNVWNTAIDALPVDANSTAYVDAVGADDNVHADFGSGLWNGGPIGIPYVEVPASQPQVVVDFEYADESDPGPYPIPANPPIEGGPDSEGDRHVLVLERDRCVLYEVYHAVPQEDGSWQAGSGAIFDLRSNVLRPAGWTSADAAGLPILPGLARYSEVAAGEIRHALRVTAPHTRRVYVWPARHFASDLTDLRYPPMGQRFRLKAGFDVAGFSPPVQVILRALKIYGLILADNGSPWYISGVPDDRWDNEMLHELHAVHGSDFEAVDVSSLMVSPDSGQVGTIEAHISASTPSARTGQVVTFTIGLRGAAGQLATTAGLTDVVPPGLAYLPGTLVATSGVPNPSGAPRLTWFGQLDATDGVTISYAVTVTANAAATIVTTAEVAASGHVPQTTSAILLANPLAAYLPLLLRNQP